MNPSTSVLTVPNRLDHLNAVVAYVVELARDSGFDEQEIGQIHLALEEAVTNVIRHGLEMNPDESFQIVCEQTDSELRLRVREKGAPFDPERIPRYSPGDPLEHSAGLGTFLMRKSMDEVRYVNLGKEGIELCLVKHLRARRIDERLSAEEKTPFRDEPQLAAAPGFTLRALRPEDAVEVSKCAYRAYGYSYYEYIYFPEKIAEYNRTGAVVSFVAAADDDDLMGHIALIFAVPGDSIAEVGVAFVKPAYRKLGLFKKLLVRAIEHGREMKLAGLMGRAVTSHIVSQKTLNELGFHDCGIFLGDLPAEFDFKGFGGAGQQRGSVVLSYASLQECAAVNLYPPEAFRPIVEQIYMRLGIPCNFADAKAAEPVDATRPADIRLSLVSSANQTDIKAVGYGEGDFETVRRMQRRLCVEKVDVIYLFLNMEDPRCAAVAGKCISLGFFLAGALPNGAAGRHALILQYLNNQEIDCNRIKLYSKDAEELLRFIVAGAPELAAAVRSEPSADQ